MINLNQILPNHSDHEDRREENKGEKERKWRKRRKNDPLWEYLTPAFFFLKCFTSSLGWNMVSVAKSGKNLLKSTAPYIREWCKAYCVCRHNSVYSVSGCFASRGTLLCFCSNKKIWRWFKKNPKTTTQKPPFLVLWSCFLNLPRQLTARLYRHANVLYFYERTIYGG